jgi:rubrerythrin
MKKRAFHDLSPKEALHVAIFIEERNAAIYQQFGELFAEFKDPESQEIARTFWEMVDEERHHGTMLQEMYFDRYGTEACSVTEDDIREIIELPRLDNPDLFAVARSGTFAPRRMALEVGLKAEQSAQRYYAQLALATNDDELRELYTELAELEDGHTAMLKKRIAAINRAGLGDHRC